jgi:hypothetical protein
LRDRRRAVSVQVSAKRRDLGIPGGHSACA